MSPSYDQPIKALRCVTLCLAFAFAVIGGSVGLNALIKANREKSFLSGKLPAGASVTVNTDDVYHTGVVVVVVCALIALTTAILTLLILAPRSTLSTRSLPLQAWALLICSLWLFAALVPFTMYVAQHEAQITATLDGLPLPPAVVQGVEKALGVTSVYKDIPYLRLVAILPWFTFLFTSFAAAISFVAIRRINNNSSHHNAIRDDLHEKTNPTA